MAYRLDELRWRTRYDNKSLSMCRRMKIRRVQQNCYRTGFPDSYWSFNHAGCRNARTAGSFRSVPNNFPYRKIHPLRRSLPRQMFGQRLHRLIADPERILHQHHIDGPSAIAFRCVSLESNVTSFTFPANPRLRSA